MKLIMHLLYVPAVILVFTWGKCNLISTPMPVHRYFISFICNHEKLETTNVHQLVSGYTGTLLSRKKKEKFTDILKNMDHSQMHCTKWRGKTEKVTFCMVPFVWYFGKRQYRNKKQISDWKEELTQKFSTRSFWRVMELYVSWLCNDYIPVCIFRTHKCILQFIHVWIILHVYFKCDLNCN